jgi:hypothetical protein
MVVVVLALLGGGGFLNYQRNAHLDKDTEFRPLKTYTDEQLAQLIEAHRENVVRLHRNAGAAPSMSTSGVHASDLEAKIEAFDRFERLNSAWKDKHALALQEQVRVEAIEREQKLRRAGLHKPWRRVLRRVITF